MSGHSKWHNIQKTKGAQDAKRAAAFTKISKEMIVAVKEGTYTRKVPLFYATKGVLFVYK